MPVHTVAEKCDCRRIRRLSPLSRRFLRQSHFSATVWTGLNVDVSFVIMSQCGLLFYFNSFYIVFYNILYCIAWTVFLPLANKGARYYFHDLLSSPISLTTVPCRCVIPPMHKLNPPTQAWPLTTESLANCWSQARSCSRSYIWSWVTPCLWCRSK